VHCRHLVVVVRVMEKPQSYSNHLRLDPKFHFVGSPLLFLGLIGALVNAILLDGRYTHWVIVVVAGGAVVIGACTRLYALQVQDRVIRLEVALRYERLSGGKSFEEILPRLTIPQIVALRFASDGELVELAERAARDLVPPGEIKRSIREWRADHYRV
jgi:hypothetical protein